ncbi:hypothetical protein HYPSUDRAFT_204935 [Hypholoma sublateritium FD-334 SS-4]|uniref:Uncharacterized protein n=1 Tax=Hypholoma sublateritium (strain FD-334 SS-4) TaxID=945553 RepID=A0A0D2M717_HYPSF|nr:hypothetical protein HYPSUDRAFT_204935 [Hypholoma sublateritium FD-334 SS-4]
MAHPSQHASVVVFRTRPQGSSCRPTAVSLPDRLLVIYTPWIACAPPPPPGVLPMVDLWQWESGVGNFDYSRGHYAFSKMGNFAAAWDAVDILQSDPVLAQRSRRQKTTPSPPATRASSSTFGGVGLRNTSVLPLCLLVALLLRAAHDPPTILRRRNTPMQQTNLKPGRRGLTGVQQQNFSYLVEIILRPGSRGVLTRAHLSPFCVGRNTGPRHVFPLIQVVLHVYDDGQPLPPPAPGDPPSYCTVNKTRNIPAAVRSDDSEEAPSAASSGGHWSAPLSQDVVPSIGRTRERQPHGGHFFSATVALLDSRMRSYDSARFPVGQCRPAENQPCGDGKPRGAEAAT